MKGPKGERQALDRRVLKFIASRLDTTFSEMLGQFGVGERDLDRCLQRLRKAELVWCGSRRFWNATEVGDDAVLRAVVAGDEPHERA